MTLKFTVDTKAVDKVINGMPKVAYFHLRAYAFGSMLEHRLKWLRTKGTKFGRGGKGIKVHRVGDTAGETDRSVVYDIPKEKRARNSKDALVKLRNFDAEIRTGNIVLPVHEFGTDVRSRSGKLMAIPLGRTKPDNIREWKAANRNRRLVFRPTRSGNLMAFEVNVGRARGRGPTPIGPGKARVKWKPRFLLTNKVEMDPILKFYDTWDSLKGERASKFAFRTKRMLADFEKADARDLN